MGFSTIDIERRMGISRERFREWVSKGYVTPSIPSPGQGRRAEFSREDLLRVALFDELLKVGFHREAAGQVISRFKLEKDPREGEPLSWVAPDFIVFIFRGDSISAMPLDGLSKMKMVLDCADGVIRMESPFAKNPIPFWTQGEGGLEQAEGLPFEHVHVVNLKGIRARVRAAFPEVE